MAHRVAFVHCYTKPGLINKEHQLEARSTRGVPGRPVVALSKRHCEAMPFICNFQPCVLLDLAWLQCDVGGVQAGKSSGLNVNQLGGVESSPHSLQCARQSSPGGGFPRHPKALSAAGAVHPQKVPAHLANHGVENRRRDLFHEVPVIAAGLPERIQTVRKDALPAQENGMRLQACALFDGMGT